MKTLQGTITSLKNTNTATVLVENRWQHPLYKKYVKKSKNFACHYQDIKLSEGDVVIIEACRPVSKTKSYKVVKVISESGVQS